MQPTSIIANVISNAIANAMYLWFFCYLIQNANQIFVRSDLVEKLFLTHPSGKPAVLEIILVH